MSFQELADPFVEQIQELIDELKSNADERTFEVILTKIDNQFPFVNLAEFIEMYINGEFSKVLIEKFHLSGYTEYKKLLEILKMNKKRKSSQMSSKSREINLADNNLAKRYEFLQSILIKFEQKIKEKIDYNVLRAIIILQLYTYVNNFTSKQLVIQSVPDAINNFEHLISAPHTQLSTFDDVWFNTQINIILEELQNNAFLEINDSKEIRLKKHQLEIPDYVFNVIQKRNGIIHQSLQTLLKKKLPLLSQTSPALLDVILHELIANNKIVKKEGYWKLKPFYDEYFTVDRYNKLNSNIALSNNHKQFFGRKIKPEEFINELVELEKGDFEDQDDQVTRIAGMILTNSNMMSHPPNELEEFDFAVDLSNYEFTKEQQNLIQNMNLVIESNIVYVKVALDEEITHKKILDLTIKLQNRRLGEQGFIISFKPMNSLTEKILKNKQTIQIISEKKLKEWCKITPIIPSRRGAVSIIRQGDYRSSIVKIKSVNYESGQADIVLLPKMNETIQYIGALEEISLLVSTEKFVEYSSKYFEFLGKLRRISETNRFRSIVADGYVDSSGNKNHPPVIIIPYDMIECNFDQSFETKIKLGNCDESSLRYSIDDLFMCTCFQWNINNRKKGLCNHLIFTLNEIVKKILESEDKLSDVILEQQLKKIEQKMDLFLNRLKYSSIDNSVQIKCPRCNKTAHTLEESKELFGYRQMNKKEKFSLRHQSRCKKCR